MQIDSNQKEKCVLSVELLFNEPQLACYMATPVAVWLKGKNSYYLNYRLT